MYKEHPVFITPEDDTKIWRYMDFIKLLDILYRSKIFFPRADQLGDPYEGSYPKLNVDYRNANTTAFLLPESLRNMNTQDRIRALSNFHRSWRNFFGISCWCMSEDESAALWHMYCGNSGGVAIQSTIRRLKESLKEEQLDIYIGKITYINYLKEKIPEENKMYPFVYKRKSFEHERELRAVILLPNFIIENNSITKILRLKGHHVKIDPNVLIENIFIAPECEKWQKRLVQSLLAKYGLKKKKVIHSDLHRKPLF
jgi:hypothetical protein